jgi:hypothetical protein
MVDHSVVLWVKLGALRLTTMRSPFSFVFKLACNSDFKQLGAADFPPPVNSSLTIVVKAARQFHVERASADTTTSPSLNY